MKATARIMVVWLAASSTSLPSIARSGSMEMFVMGGKRTRLTTTFRLSMGDHERVRTTLLHSPKAKIP